MYSIVREADYNGCRWASQATIPRVSEARPRLVQRMSAKDNVATALRDLTPGELVEIDDLRVTVTARVPFGHKVALRAIGGDEPVLKYGEAIGLASSPIAAGDHVHTHNVESQRGRGDLHR
jgi:altronate dehydratase small subunit